VPSAMGHFGGRGPPSPLLAGRPVAACRPDGKSCCADRPVSWAAWHFLTLMVKFANLAPGATGDAALCAQAPRLLRGRPGRGSWLALGSRLDETPRASAYGELVGGDAGAVPGVLRPGAWGQNRAVADAPG